MKDTYIKSTDHDAILKFTSDFKNSLGPNQGQAACTVDGVDYPAVGDPAYWYAHIRTNVDYTFPFNGVEEAMAEEVVAVCGAVL